ncbi:NmrA family transcriptional regulator [Micromonospora acroterricola]|uniref:NmrA family transcriptional regulator n=1 Tax=Micromonospora acroterricola TaxID=2202421 RepID=A0A317CTP8_9ACTN|nr:NAD(P)H-binding protein [Micromonospora acroterricola]PWR05532.1 NmrA family transcriptional regulator [Micromonospora acroterricola]
MKIVVVGGSGLIGSKLVTKLGGQGHEAVPASPKTGVNTLTGEGVADVLVGADVVVDVSNSPSFEDTAVREFFETSTRNLLAAATDAGVGHYVALSIVGSDRLPDSGYMRAKVAQEKLVAASGLPYSLVHATQFFEFVQGILDAATDGDTVHLAPVLIQPMAADDVAAAVAEVAVGAPTNGTVEIAGPEQFRLDELGRSVLTARQDARSVVTDPGARYFGATLGERSLVPLDGARVASTSLDDWRAQAARQG